MTWTEQKIQMLKDMCGNHSASEIAEHIGKKPKAATQDLWRWFRRGLRDVNLR